MGLRIHNSPIELSASILKVTNPIDQWTHPSKDKGSIPKEKYLPFLWNITAHLGQTGSKLI